MSKIIYSTFKLKNVNDIRRLDLSKDLNAGHKLYSFFSFIVTKDERLVSDFTWEDSYKKEEFNMFRDDIADYYREKLPKGTAPKTLVIQFIERSNHWKEAFDGSIIEKDFPMVKKLVDIRRIGEDVLPLLKKGKMYKIKTFLEISLSDPKDANKPPQIRKLYVNLPEIYTRENMRYDEVAEELIWRFEEQIDIIEDVEGPGLVLEEILIFHVTLMEVRLGAGIKVVKQPLWLQNKKCTIDLTGDGKKCFQYAVIASLKLEDFRKKCGQTRKKYTTYEPFIKDYDWTGIPFPTPIDNSVFIQFEKRNPGISLRIFCISEDDKDPSNVRILYAGANAGAKASAEQRVANILLIISAGDDGIGHFVPITSPNRLVNSRDDRKNEHRNKHLCMYCAKTFKKEDELERHTSYCGTDKAQPSFPKEICMFEGHRKKVICPFIVYADTEAIIEAGTGRHIPICVSYIVFHREGEERRIFRKKTITGLDCISQFLADMKDIARIYSRLYYSMIKPLGNLGPHPCCMACEKVATHKRVRGGFPFYCTGCLPSRTIPVYFHNLKGYDGSFIIKKLHELDEGAGGNEPKVIAKNANGLMGVTKMFVFHATKVRRFFSIKFMDSNQLMTGSLEKLAAVVNDWSIVPLTYPEIQRAKGFFPYEYLDSVERLDEEALPPPEKFYSTLKEEGISDSGYAFAQDVWCKTGCKTLKDYMEFYCETDVLLLANIFENFRDTCMSAYKLDPAHYMSAPGLTWDAMLLFTGNQFKLIQDEEQIEFIQRAIRGGISQCNIHYLKTNHPRLVPDLYDEDQPLTELKYLDANNLYGWAMSEPMPTGGVRWVDAASLDVSTLPPCFLEVDLEYPTHLQEKHSDLPLAPHHHEFPGRAGTRLITSVVDRKNYVLHYRLLQFYLKEGLVLKKIHRVLAFDESPCLAEYIDFNTKMRAAGKTDFEKNFYKLMNNSMFGKTIEDVRKYRDYKFVTTRKQILKHGPRTKHVTMLTRQEDGDSNDSALLELKQDEYRYVKPIFVGATVLELSKLLMYDMHYNYFRPKFPGIRLGYIDTDSFIYSVPLVDPHKTFNDIVRDDIIENGSESIYDTSAMADFPKELRINKKVIGKFKDELNGKAIAEFVGIRSKVYAFREEDGKFTKKNKGLKEVCVRKHLTFDDYKTLFETGDEPEPAHFVQFVRRAGEIRSERRKKIMMAANDIKRVQLYNPVTNEWLPDTRPIGWR